ncbi:hypothetical protein BKA70DRAFT_1464612 [Coprinopsis sp. MPI-PUGE-AT-0042]|nr:hypothetical protein BKA70DRAFT_1464612 [Coprinopsis sp. MPI-PUGE-AT-0042]
MRGHAAIPTEILLEIFQQSLPRRLDQEGRLLFQIIRSVCSRWRAISFSSPVLWSSVSITCNIGDQGFHDGYLSDMMLLDVWFSRAGPSISLELKYEDPVVSVVRDKEVAAMKALIRRYQPRWRYLSLFIEPKCFWDAFLDHPTSDWTNLHTLKLCAFDFVPIIIGQDVVSQGYDALEKIASLRRLIVEDHDDWEYTRRFGPIDVTELHITLDVFGIDQSRLISSYSSLTRLVLVAPPRLTSGPPLDSPITLPTLLSFSYNTYNLFLLYHFTTPTLAELDIQLNSNLKAQEALAVSAFLSRCSSPLRMFTLNSHTNGAFITNLLPALSIQPSLTHLNFDIWPENFNLPKDKEHDWFCSLRDLTVCIRSHQ